MQGLETAPTRRMPQYVSHGYLRDFTLHSHGRETKREG